MAKFEKNENGEYVCPECERSYDKYNSVFYHYKLKHGNSPDNSPIVEKVNRAGKSITNKAKETLKTATKGIMGSDSENDLADDDDESSEIENNATDRIATKIKRVRLRPVEPPVKKPQKDTENEDDKERETETWIIPGILKVSSKNKQKKQKLSQEDVDKKWLLIEGLL
jgi:hypothetical protein